MTDRKDVLVSTVLFDQIMAEREALRARVAELEVERDHWKANHANAVEMKRRKDDMYDALLHKRAQ